MTALSYAGFVIALVGAILIILFGLFDLLKSPFLIFTPIAAIGTFARGVVSLIFGIICAIGARFVRHIGWAIILIILGAIAGNIGGILVVLGALLGLIARFAKA